jgi:hypothetical protein
MRVSSEVQHHAFGRQSPVCPEVASHAAPAPLAAGGGWPSAPGRASKRLPHYRKYRKYRKFGIAVPPHHAQRERYGGKGGKGGNLRQFSGPADLQAISNVSAHPSGDRFAFGRAAETGGNRRKPLQNRSKHPLKASAPQHRPLPCPTPAGSGRRQRSPAAAGSCGCWRAARA